MQVEPRIFGFFQLLFFQISIQTPSNKTHARKEVGFLLRLATRKIAGPVRGLNHLGNLTNNKNGVVFFNPSRMK
jgi:hypothetical protein